MTEIHLPKLKCERCGYMWIPRKPKKPQTCPNPKCRSPYWQTKRRLKKGGDSIGAE